MVVYRANVVKYLTLIRGLPGAGKTSWMWSVMSDMLEDYIAIATDDWFTIDGVYDFERIMEENPNALKENHLKCQGAAIEAMEEGRRVFVNNTFTQRWEMEPYLVAAEKLGYRIDVISLFDNGCTDEELFERCKHGVPLKHITTMRARYEHDWRNGDPRPPWKRDKPLTLIQQAGIANMAATIASGTDPIHEAEEAEKLDLSIKEVTDEEFEKARNSIPDEQYKIDLDDRQREKDIDAALTPLNKEKK